MLRVVRYSRGLGLSQHELAYVEQIEGDRFKYVFAGREHVGPLNEFTASTIPVNPSSMTSSGIVMAVVQRDICALEQTLQVNSTVDQTVNALSLSVFAHVFISECHCVFAGLCHCQ